MQSSLVGFRERDFRRKMTIQWKSSFDFSLSFELFFSDSLQRSDRFITYVAFHGKSASFSMKFLNWFDFLDILRISDFLDSGIPICRTRSFISMARFSSQ